MGSNYNGWDVEHSESRSIIWWLITDLHDESHCLKENIFFSFLFCLTTCQNSFFFIFMTYRWNESNGDELAPEMWGIQHI